VLRDSLTGVGSLARDSKSIRFGLMSNQEIQRVAEFHVFERNLYQMPQRAPLKNGILDTRLVRRVCASLSAAGGVGGGAGAVALCVDPKLDKSRRAHNAGHD
jgi:hypothetical protein